MKKGFTLVELLAIIAILAILVVFIVPNVIKTYNESKNTLSDVQQEQVKSAMEMYISDYCINPISDQYNCPFTTGIDNTTGMIKVISGTISLEDFAETDYFNKNEITNNCSGDIIITNGEISFDNNFVCDFGRKSR